MNAINDLLVGMGLLVSGITAAVILTFLINIIGRRFNKGENIININLF